MKRGEFSLLYQEKDLRVSEPSLRLRFQGVAISSGLSF